MGLYGVLRPPRDWEHSGRDAAHTSPQNSARPPQGRDNGGQGGIGWDIGIRQSIVDGRCTHAIDEEGIGGVGAAATWRTLRK